MGHCLFMRKGEVHTAPVTGVLASSLAVGSTVKLMEGGTAVEYLVVNQGIPGNSSLYDASCDGTWLLRKDIHSNRQWNTSNVNKYEISTINTWLNGEFFNTLGSAEQAAIKQVKIPYCLGNASSTVSSGENGLLSNVFLLSAPEIGRQQSATFPIAVDGEKLDYFELDSVAGSDGKRIAYMSGAATGWFLRSPNISDSNNVWIIMRSGSFYGGNFASAVLGIRPALVLPGNAVFDETTMLLNGVK